MGQWLSGGSLMLLALGLLLLLAGCAAAPDKSDENRKGGFYGGVSGGITRLP
jgi:hypothetical protein